MTAQQALVHVREAFRAAQGTFVTSKGPMPLPVPPRVLKFLALKTPFEWRRGLETVPELKMDVPGAPLLGEFAEDCASAVAEMERFALPGKTYGDHPMFGKMSWADWMRWGYLHADHHLRQFGR